MIKRGRLDRLRISSVPFHAAQETALFGTFATLFFARLLRRLLTRTGWSPETS